MSWLTASTSAGQARRARCPRRPIWLLGLIAALALTGCDFVSRGSEHSAGNPPGLPESTARPSPVPALSPTPAAQSTAASTPAPARSPEPGQPAAGIVAVASEKDQSLTLVDAATNQVTKTVRLGVPVRSLAVGPDGRTAWVFSGRPGESDVYFADLAKGEGQGSKRLRDAPRAVAFSSDGSRAFVALYEGNAVSFLDATRWSEFGQVRLGRQTEGVQLRRRPGAVAVARGPGGETLYVAGQGSGVVWALDAGSGRSLAEIEVGGGPIALLPSPTGDRLYVLSDTLDQLVAVDTGTLRVAQRLSLPGRAAGATIARDGTIYVTAPDVGEVWAVDRALRAVAARVRVGPQPGGIAASTDGARVYAANAGDGTLSAIDVPTRKVVATVRVGQAATGVAFASLPSQSAPPTPTAARPTPTPTMVPTPTPLPPNARPPEHMPPNAVKETFVPGAQFPAAMAFAPDGRLFYGELRTGRIRVVQNGVLLPDPFYEFAVAGQPETGLLGLALDPDFPRNHYVYVFYTEVAGGDQQSGGSNGPNQVVRLTDVNGKGADLVPILRDLPSGPIHNAGGLRFGPDGKLYVSIGDNDSGSNAQDASTPAGKILRVNPDGSIPDGNPFVGQRGKRPAIWADGLRNVFRFDFHPASRGLLAMDNGPGDNDEIDLVVRGGDYGWPPAGYQDKPGLIDPIAVMNPPVAPSGVAFYVGDQFTEWKNDLFYCNYHQGQLRRVHLAPVSYDRVVFEEVVTSGCTLEVATGPDGALYYSDVGGIYRIRRPGARALAAVAGGTPTGTPTERLPAGTQPQDRDVNVTLTEWRLTPSRTKVPAGRIRFLAENVGATIHALRIVGKGVDVRTEQFGPGQSRQLEVDLAPGTYHLDCPVGRHADQGMVATLVVEGP